MAPKFRIYAHVASFGTMFLVFTGCAVGYAMIAGKSENDKIAELQKLYPDVNNKRSEKNKSMQLIFDKMKRGEDINEFQDVLKGGKGYNHIKLLLLLLLLLLLTIIIITITLRDKKQHENLQKMAAAAAASSTSSSSISTTTPPTSTITKTTK